MRKEELVKLFEMGFTMGSGEDKMILAVDYNTTTDNYLSLISFNKHYNPIDFWSQDKKKVKHLLYKVYTVGNEKVKNSTKNQIKVSINQRVLPFVLGA